MHVYFAFLISYRVCINLSYFSVTGIKAHAVSAKFPNQQILTSPAQGATSIEFDIRSASTVAAVANKKK